MNEEKMYSEEYVMDLVTNFRMIGIVKRDLEKENKQLKDKLKGVQEERDYLFNKTSVENKYLQQDRDKLKEVIEEVRESKDEYVCTEEYCGEVGIETTKFIEKLGQILDKVKEL